MAGVHLGQFAEVINAGPDKQFVRGHKTRGFGRVHRFCFEGDLCSWKVKGGGFFSLTLNALADKVIALNTNAPGWTTPEGIGRGSTISEVQAAYPAAKLRTRCVAPAGAEVTGLLLRAPGKDTMFSLDPNRPKVDRIHVVDRAYRCR